MINTRFLPTLLIIIDVLAAAAYATHGFSEWRKVGYWLAAAVLTYCVTY